MIFLGRMRALHPNADECFPLKKEAGLGARNDGTESAATTRTGLLLVGDSASPRAKPASRGGLLLPALVLAAQQGRS